MDKELLERLIIDQSLGALNEDMTQLLEHYIKENELSNLSDEYCDVIKIVKEQRNNDILSLPPLKSESKITKGFFAKVALLIIGLALGYLFSPKENEVIVKQAPEKGIEKIVENKQIKDSSLLITFSKKIKTNKNTPAAFSQKEIWAKLCAKGD